MMETIKHMAKLAAQAVQEKADTMTGTELNAEDRFIPDFQTAKEKKICSIALSGLSVRVPQSAW